MRGPYRPGKFEIQNGADPDKTYGLESDHHDAEVESFLRNNPGEELLRSNIVEIEIIAANSKSENE
jgi:hypothetical protein